MKNIICRRKYGRKSDGRLPFGLEIWIARVVVQDVGLPAVTPGDLEGALYELKMRKVDLPTLEGEVPVQKA